MEILNSILNNMKECFVFSQTHHFSNISLFKATIFDTQLKLEENKYELKDIDIFKEIKPFLEKLKDDKIIYDYKSNILLNCFYIFENEDSFNDNLYEFILSLPEYNNDIA